MHLDTNGLPQPGRELDADVWEMLGHEVYRNRDAFLDAGCPHGIYFNMDCIYPAYWSSKYMNSVPVPEISTTHAFFQVMEGMRKHDRQFRHSLYANDNAVDILVWDKNFLETRKLWNVEVEIADYPSREHAYAHAVCACAWKVGQNE